MTVSTKFKNGDLVKFTDQSALRFGVFPGDVLRVIHVFVEQFLSGAFVIYTCLNPRSGAICSVTNGHLLLSPATPCETCNTDDGTVQIRSYNHDECRLLLCEACHLDALRDMAHDAERAAGWPVLPCSRCKGAGLIEAPPTSDEVIYLDCPKCSGGREP